MRIWTNYKELYSKWNMADFQPSLNILKYEHFNGKINKT